MKNEIPMWHFEELYKIYHAVKNDDLENFSYMVRKLVEYGWGCLSDDWEKTASISLLKDIQKELGN